jgi:hypothetical protein
MRVSVPEPLTVMKRVAPVTKKRSEVPLVVPEWGAQPPEDVLKHFPRPPPEKL